MCRFTPLYLLKTVETIKMATERLSIEKRVKCVRLYSATKNLSEVQRLLLQEYGPPATKLNS